MGFGGTSTRGVSGAKADGTTGSCDVRPAGHPTVAPSPGPSGCSPAGPFVSTVAAMRSRLPAVAACLLGPLAIIAALGVVAPAAPLAAQIGVLGAALAGSLAVLYVRTLYRLGALAGIAERLAAGDLEATVERPWVGHVGRVERALNETANRLSVTHDAATTDRLTQVANRGSVLATLDQEVERAVRHDRPLSIAFADIDHFKDINDSHGHHIGDVVLRTVADLFRSHLRVSDVVGRFGGEEFMLGLPDAAPE